MSHYNFWSLCVCVCIVGVCDETANEGPERASSHDPYSPIGGLFNLQRQPSASECTCIITHLFAQPHTHIHNHTQCDHTQTNFSQSNLISDWFGKHMPLCLCSFFMLLLKISSLPEKPPRPAHLHCSNLTAHIYAEKIYRSIYHASHDKRHKHTRTQE